jgi:hypothetical protein
MTTQPDLILDALKECAIQLRNMETASQGKTFSLAYAKQYDDYLAVVLSLVSHMHTKCREAIISDAIRTLNCAGFDVVPSKSEAN